LIAGPKRKVARNFGDPKKNEIALKDLTPIDNQTTMESIVQHIELVVRDMFVPYLLVKLGENGTKVDLEMAQKCVAEWISESYTVQPLVPATKQAAAAVEKISHSDKRTTAVLKALLKERGLPISGTKVQLIDRLNGEDEVKRAPSEKKVKAPPKSKALISTSEDEEEKKPTRKLAKPAKKAATKSKPAVVQKIVELTDDIEIVVDEFGHLVNEATGLVFNEHNDAIAYKDENGDVLPLNSSKIEMCKKLQLNFVVPDNIASDDEE
jgi:hypothetical protein